MVAKYKLVLWIPVVGIVIIFLALYLPEIVGAHLELSYTDRTNIILTFAIMIFAAVEGYSTFLQVVLEDRRNQIEDAKNELEKAYGPLYTLLRHARRIETDDRTVELSGFHKPQLDEILSTYPFMFPTEIYDLWQKKIRNLVDAPYYHIPLEFIEKMNEEYDRRVKKYNELLKK